MTMVIQNINNHFSLSLFYQKFRFTAYRVKNRITPYAFIQPYQAKPFGHYCATVFSNDELFYDFILTFTISYGSKLPKFRTIFREQRYLNGNMPSNLFTEVLPINTLNIQAKNNSG